MSARISLISVHRVHGGSAIVPKNSNANVFTKSSRQWRIACTLLCSNVSLLCAPSQKPMNSWCPNSLHLTCHGTWSVSLTLWSAKGSDILLMTNKEFFLQISIFSFLDMTLQIFLNPISSFLLDFLPKDYFLFPSPCNEDTLRNCEIC